MKISKTVEQGVYVVLMIALEKDHAPVKCNVLSELLGVSESYLMKILHKMVVGGIIRSTASKTGGYQLAKNVEDITLYDVFHSIEGDGEIKLSMLAHRLFVDDEKLKAGEEKVINCFHDAFADFDNRLKSFRLSDLMIKENYTKGWIHWADRISRCREKSVC